MPNREVDVLLVEDNPHDLEMTIRALRKHNLGNRLFSLPDGAEALDFIFARGKYSDRDINQSPQVVFLDLKLPKVDGIEVLRQVKADDRTKHIPIVIVTSSAEERDRVASYNLGANSYVVKPIVFESFAKTIAEVGFYWLAVNKPSH
jgi:two-component system, response regulator